MGTPTSKDVKWMRLCVAGAQVFSTCSKAQYFAILVDANGYQRGSGWNGGPKGFPHCSDGACPRAISGSNDPTYADCFAIHAEQNCMIHADTTACHGGTMYVNGVPCFTCTKLLVNSGLTRVVYLEGGPEREIDKVTRFFEACGVELVACEF